MKKLILYILLACCGLSETFAAIETPSTQGSEFYFSIFRAIGDREKTMLLFVSAEKAGVLKFTDASGTVTTKNFNAGTTKITLANVTKANSKEYTGDGTSTVVTGDLPNCYTIKSNSVENKGYAVEAFESDGTTPQKVSLYGGINGTNTADFANIYPIEALGTEYYIVNHAGFTYSSMPASAEALVVATEDNTTIEIIPTCLLDDQSAGDDLHGIITKTLHKGQTYMLRAQNANSIYVDAAAQGRNDLTGTIIRTKDDGGSNKCRRIAVFSGTPHGQPGDFEYEQLFPAHLWGKDYLVDAPAYSYTTIVRVVASQPCTEVSINGTKVAELNQTDYYEYVDRYSEGCFVSASKPVEVASFSTPERDQPNTQSHDDASMIVFAPVEQRLDSIIFTAPCNGNIGNYYVSIAAPTEYLDKVELYQLSGTTRTPVALAGWTAIGTTGFSKIAIGLTCDASYLIKSDEGGFNAFVYTTGGDMQYGYPVGASAIINQADFYAGGDPDLNAANGGCLAKDTEFDAYLPFVYGSIKWQFGDGTEETIQYPNVKVTHKYDLTEQEQIDGKEIDVTMIVYKNATGCFDTSTSDTVVGKYTVRPAIQTADNVAICKNDTLQCPRSASEFGAGETITYKWFNAAGTEVGNQPFQQITDAHGADAKYWVRSRDNACHFYIDTFYVHVREIGTSFDAKNPFCEGDEIKSKNAGSTYAEYTKTNPISYKWYNKNNPTVEVAVTETFKPSNGKGENAAYFVKSENGCLYVDTFSISIPAKIEVNLTTDKSKVCETASQVTLTASATPAASVLSTEWNGQATTETVFIETPITTTTYTYTAKGSCETVDKSVTVEVNPAFTAELEAESNDFIGLNVLPVSGGTVTFKVSIDIPGSYIYEWKPKTVSTTASYTQNVVEDVSYWVEVFDADRLCSATTNQVAIVLGEVTMPTVFVPGIDREFGATAWNSTVPLNDTFTYGYSLGIYNRYGGQIFFKNYAAGELPEGWNGTYKSKIADAGVYFYVIEYKVADGSAKALKGSIEIVKP